MFRFIKMTSVISVLLVTTVTSFAAGLRAGDYPMGPDVDGLTPGAVCKDGNSRRYPERIRYCQRNVDQGEKWEVINAYNRKFGYHITSSNRQDFKIDHLIPLCMGGANELDNLWPQHKSIYPLTDALEEAECEKMAAGRLKQDRAIELIMQAKLNLDQADDILRMVRAL